MAMDSNTRDESSNRRREEALARQLGEALDRVAPGGSPDPCPDPELIAAYHEQALGPEESTQCDSHFAACSRCRKILAVLAASDDTPLAETEVARLGELVAAARAPGVAVSQTSLPARQRKLLDWRVRWLAPALGVAAVLAVWFAMKPPWRNATDQGSSGTLIAQAPKNEALPLPEPTPQAQVSVETPAKSLEKNSSALPASPNDHSLARNKPVKPPVEALAGPLETGRNAIGAQTPNAATAESSPADKKQSQQILGGAPSTGSEAAAGKAAPPPLLQAQASQEAAPPPATPFAAGASGNSPTRPSPAPRALAGAGTGGGLGGIGTNSSAPQVPSESPLSARNYRAFGAAKVAGETPALIKSPYGANFWRAGKDGRIERSTDVGRTWVLEETPLQEDWLAGIAVSETICWLVGRHGAIARTTDGVHWERIAPPSMAADASGRFPDWIDVTASNLQTTTISASDQRRYATRDGGKTWQVVQAN